MRTTFYGTHHTPGAMSAQPGMPGPIRPGESQFDWYLKNMPPQSDQFAAAQAGKNMEGMGLRPVAGPGGLPMPMPAPMPPKIVPRNNGGAMTPVGEAPYTPSMSSYKRTGFRAPIRSGRSRLDPTRIAEKMARGNARPGEVQAIQLLQRQQEFDARLPILQNAANQAQFSNEMMSDPRFQDMLRRYMDEATGALAQSETPSTPRTSEDYVNRNGGLSPQRPSALDAAYRSGAMTRPGQMATRSEGGEMGEEDEGGEDAYLLGEEGPEMVIKRDDGSMFVLPADVTEKIMSGLSMEDTEDNQNAMAAAMQRMGMEVAPKMCGGKMKPRMNGGPMMAKETGRIDPGASRSKTRKNTLFDAMKRLV